MAPKGGVDDEESDSDEEQVEREYHIWLAAFVIIGGAIIMVAPDHQVPEIITGLGPLFLVLGVVGWLLTWAYKRWGDGL